MLTPGYGFKAYQGSLKQGRVFLHGVQPTYAKVVIFFVEFGIYKCFGKGLLTN